VSGTELVGVLFGTLAFAAIGSFTCVIIDRLPLKLDEPNEYGELWDTRPWRDVLGGHSRCSSCGIPVRAIDNVPVLSWLILRGRCRACRAPISPRYPIVELAAGALALGERDVYGFIDDRTLAVLAVVEEEQPAARRRRCEHLPGRRIHRVEARAVRRVAPLPVDEHAGGGRGCGRHDPDVTRGRPDVGACVSACDGRAAGTRRRTAG